MRGHTTIIEACSEAQKIETAVRTIFQKQDPPYPLLTAHVRAEQHGQLLFAMSVIPPTLFPIKSSAVSELSGAPKCYKHKGDC